MQIFARPVVGAGAALAVSEPEAVAVHLEDVNVVGEASEQRDGEALGGEHCGPLVEGRLLVGINACFARAPTDTRRAPCDRQATAATIGRSPSARCGARLRRNHARAAASIATLRIRT